MLRIGFGYDVHPLIEGRPLILGGAEIPHKRGLQGHSDADVLTHAVIDAVIGALGAGDIGRHFPDTDPAFKDASSLGMLKEVGRWVREKALTLNNLDATIVAQRPKLAPFIPRMKENLSSALGVEPERVNIKAKTTEGLGFCGREEGMAAFAVVSLTKE
jgi:2-C-methyl-D-erythritol 2,4-cyclodiphosphate synthase